MSFEGKNVFVSGADGFIGKWLVERLIKEKANVVALFRSEKSEQQMGELQDKIISVRGDITNYDVVLRAINEYEIDLIYHLAAQTLVGNANSDPTPTFETNIKGTWNVLEAARVVEVDGVVVASTDKAYGKQDTLPLVESMKLLGNHPYDVSKACADTLARTYAHSYKLNVAIARPSNVYGGGDENWSRIIPGTIRSVLQNLNPEIRSDGTAVRDYLYVEDVIEAYITLMQKLLSDDIKGEAFNISTNSPISVLEVVDKVQKIAGKNLVPDFRRTATNEIHEQYLDNAKATNVLGWKPQYSLDEGLKKTIEWYSAQS